MRKNYTQIIPNTSDYNSPLFRYRIVSGGTEKMSIPKDPVMLLSFVNTQLRDNYPSLEELASSYGISAKEIEDKLKAIDYSYDKENNRFV